MFTARLTLSSKKPYFECIRDLLKTNNIPKNINIHPSIVLETTRHPLFEKLIIPTQKNELWSGNYYLDLMSEIFSERLTNVYDKNIKNQIWTRTKKKENENKNENGNAYVKYPLSNMDHSDHSKLEFHMPEVSDLVPVNAARVSMNRRVSEFRTIEETEELQKKYPNKKFRNSDEGLLNYLIQHNHWTPCGQLRFLTERTMYIDDYLEWCRRTQDCNMYRVVFNSESKYLSFYEYGSAHAYGQHGALLPYMREYIPHTANAYDTLWKSWMPWTPWTPLEDISKYDKPHMAECYGLRDFEVGDKKDQSSMTALRWTIAAPSIVARQWFKSVGSIVRNEGSGRYIEFDDMKCYYPSTFRQQALNVKQGSADHGVDDEASADAIYMELQKHGYLTYRRLLDLGVCKEQARAVLSQAHYFEWVETGSLWDYYRIIRLRSHDTAQKEIRAYADSMQSIINVSQFSDMYYELERWCRK